MPTPLLVLVAGPTASGKTAAAIRLAHQFSTEIISADSRQFYREIPIGTAAPTTAEQEGIAHHWLGNRSIAEPIDAGEYGRQVRELLGQLFLRLPVVILTGGSGLYINAVLRGFDDLPQADPALREALKQQLASAGIAALQAELQALDPVYYALVDRNNPARLIRAIEVCRSTGRPYSDLRSNQRDPLPFRVVKIGLDLPRESLYARIDKRVQHMMELGLEAEARAVLPHRHQQALQTVGYRELFDYFDGKTDLGTAITLIQQHTRNYAKRQLTWLRREEELHLFAPEQTTEMIRLIQTFT